MIEGLFLVGAALAPWWQLYTRARTIFKQTRPGRRRTRRSMRLGLIPKVEREWMEREDEMRVDRSIFAALSSTPPQVQIWMLFSPALLFAGLALLCL